MLTCIIVYGTKRHSKNLRIKSEALDMNLYVSIRCEFNALEEVLGKKKIFIHFSPFLTKSWVDLFESVMQQLCL